MSWDIRRNSSLESVTSRLVIGTIESVDAENGFVRVRFDGSALLEPTNVTIPMTGASFSGDRPSWMRYMPSRLDRVIVAFGRDNRPVIVSYDPLAVDSTVANGRVGYPLFAKFNKTPPNKVDDAGVPTGDTDNRWNRFDPLKEGEWDFMSTGGAYIKGDASGALTLRGGGGVAELKIAGSNDSISGYSRVFNYDAGPSSLQFGYIRRQNVSTGYLEVDAVPGAPILHPQEFNLNLRYDTGAASAYASRFSLGFPVYMNNTIAPALSTATMTPGTPLSMVLYTFAPGDVLGEVPGLFAMEVDQLGGYGLRATTMNYLAGAVTEAYAAHVHGVTTYALTAATSIAVTAPIIGFNTVPVPAVSNVVKQSYLTAQATAVTTALAALTPLVAALLPTPVTGTQVQAIMAPLIALLTAMEVNFVNPLSSSQTVHVGP